MPGRKSLKRQMSNYESRMGITAFGKLWIAEWEEFLVLATPEMAIESYWQP